MIKLLNSLFQSTPSAEKRPIAGHSIYFSRGCPYCLIVQQVIKQLVLEIEVRNINKDKQHLYDLQKEGGQRMVPCLRIDKGGETQWMYESSSIIQYLKQQFPLKN